MLITVKRTSKSEDGIFGNLVIDGNPFKCVTLENLAKEIPAGIYDMNITYSKRFNRVMPHIIVPVRDAAAGGDAGIRFHWANFPTQLEGCIALGEEVDGDAIDSSKIEFNQFFEIVKNEPAVKVKIVEDYA